MKPLRKELAEVLHTFALEDLQERRRFSDGTWNNLAGGSDAAFIVNYIDDVTKAYRSFQARHALTYTQDASTGNGSEVKMFSNRNQTAFERPGNPKERRYLQI